MQYSLLVVALLLALLVGTSAAAGSNDKNVNYLKRTGKKYLDEIAARPDAILLKSGMVVEIMHKSDKENAKSPMAGDACEVTYLGTLKDGTRFDGGTTSFAPNQVSM